MKTLIFVFFLMLGSPSPVFAQAQQTRARQPMMKGIELYSWKDRAAKTWCYVLVPGTNREKTTEEIRRGPSVASIDDLERAIAGLAKGETVFWTSRDAARFPLPPQNTVNRIVAYAASKDVRVEVIRPSGAAK